MKKSLPIFVWIALATLLHFSCSEEEAPEEEEVDVVEEKGPVIPTSLDTVVNFSGGSESYRLNRVDVDSFLVPFKIYLPGEANVSFNKYVAPKKKSKEIFIGDQITLTFEGGKLEFGDLNQALDNNEAKMLVRRLFGPTTTLRKFRPDYRFSMYKIVPESNRGVSEVLHLSRKKGKLFYVKEFYSSDSKAAQERLYEVVLNSILWKE